MSFHVRPSHTLIPLHPQQSVGKPAHLLHRKSSWVILLFLLIGIYYGSTNNVPSALAAGSSRPSYTVLGRHITPGPHNPHRVTNDPTTGDSVCGGCGTPPLVYKGGPVQHHPRVYLVFWGSEWQNDVDQVIPAMQILFQELGGGDYNNILTQYTDNPNDPNAFVHNDVVLAGTWIDTDAVPTLTSTNQYANEAGYAMAVNQWSNSSDTQIMVFPQQGTVYGSYFNTPGPGVCGEHNYLTDNARVNLVTSFIRYSSDWNCNWGGGVVGNMAKVAAHEYAESATDPEPDYNNAWRTNDGSEIGDLCNSNSFDYTPVDYGFSIFTQELWDNRAYQEDSSDGCDKAEGQEYAVPPSGKHTVQGAILNHYQNPWHANIGTLGPPTSEQTPIAGGLVSYFANGCGAGSAIYVSSATATDAYAVIGCIMAYYKGLGEANSDLGFPVWDETDSPEGGRVSYFGGTSWGSHCGSPGPYNSYGAIYWTGSQALQVIGCIYNYYAHSSGLGLPVNVAQGVPGNHSEQFTGSSCGSGYSGNVIYDVNGDGVHDVKGCIWMYYNQIYGSAGIGYPTSDEITITGGIVQYFDHGVGMYDGSGTGVHTVGSAIEREFQALLQASNDNSFLGFPVSDETGVSTGRVSYFGGTSWGSHCGNPGPYNSYGAIYWTSATAHEVHGCLYDAYVNRFLGPGGRLGFPTSDQENPSGGGHIQYFQNGYLLENSGGTITMHINCTTAC